jgi:hypothetical protein
VIDRTGLTGAHDFDLDTRWTRPDAALPHQTRQLWLPIARRSSRRSKNSSGLLQPSRAPIDVLVIDR